MMPTKRTRCVAVAPFAIILSACGDGGCPAVEPPELPPERQALLDPESPAFDETAPDSFRVRLETTRGDVVIRITRAWSPLGADRFYNLVRNGFFDDAAFFRVIPGFVAQFGMHGVPAVNEAWIDQTLEDEPVVVPNARMTLTYAQAGPATRTTQLFINYRDNSETLDAQGFAPIGSVVEGSDVLFRLHGDYGDFPPAGEGPDPGCMMQGGNRYLERDFERLDYIRTATVES